MGLASRNLRIDMQAKHTRKAPDLRHSCYRGWTLQLIRSWLRCRQNSLESCSLGCYWNSLGTCLLGYPLGRWWVHGRDSLGTHPLEWGVSITGCLGHCQPSGAVGTSRELLSCTRREALSSCSVLKWPLLKKLNIMPSGKGEMFTGPTPSITKQSKEG